MQVKGIFEIAIRVKDLARAANFYEEVLGFQHGLLDAERRWLFLWVNGKAGMVVLQEDPGPWPQQPGGGASIWPAASSFIPPRPRPQANFPSAAARAGFWRSATRSHGGPGTSAFGNPSRAVSPRTSRLPISGPRWCAARSPDW